MRIAFDLDGTLIPMPGSAVRVERAGVVARLISPESLREGTGELFRELRARGHEVCIYTTSLRAPTRLRLWLRAYAAPVALVINQARHEEKKLCDWEKCRPVARSIHQRSVSNSSSTTWQVWSSRASDTDLQFYASTLAMTSGAARLSGVRRRVDPQRVHTWR